MDRDARNERLCRLWLLAIAVLHWVVFGLLVRNSEHVELVAPARTLAAFVTRLFFAS